jgi:hypothetical protein
MGKTFKKGKDFSKEEKEDKNTPPLPKGKKPMLMIQIGMVKPKKGKK